MEDRCFLLTSQAIRKQLAAMPNEIYLVRLIHHRTRRAFPGERLWTTEQLGRAATVRFLRVRNREGCDVYVQPYAGDRNAGYILVDLDGAKPTTINVALVVSRCGMPLGYEIFAGKRNDATTLEEIARHVEGLYGRANRIWVMDRAMAGADNVEFLREGGRRYIVGTAKNSLCKFERELLAEDWERGTYDRVLSTHLVFLPGTRNRSARFSMVHESRRSGPSFRRFTLVCPAAAR